VVAGASGYVGRRVVARLVEGGHDVVAFSRHEPHQPGGPNLQTAAVDVADPVALRSALAGADAAYYLIHSMGEGSNFADRDRRLAETFRDAAASAGVARIVYLGGLGSSDLSRHLASRQEVGAVLRSGPVPVVELRAAVVLGAGSISFEILRSLTERLPVMVCPRWVGTRIQPIAERELVDRLVRSLEVEAGVYEVGGPEVTTYRQMIESYARVRGLRRRHILDVGVVTPRLSAHWVDLVTPVDRAVSHNLIDSLTTEVVVHDDAADQTFGRAVVGVDAAIATALDDQASRVPDELFTLASAHDGLSSMHESAAVAADDVAAVRTGLRSCGGDLDWYGLASAWRLRLLLGRPFGERLRLHRPEQMEEGARVDWWTVERLARDEIVLGTDQWFCGEAWLGYRLEHDEQGARVAQSAALRPKGLLGVAYWWALWPVHLVVFEVMARRQATVKRRAAEERPQVAGRPRPSSIWNAP
jgi:uncharacterized protein YbjT (DUF2867 family)